MSNLTFVVDESAKRTVPANMQAGTSQLVTIATQIVKEIMERLDANHDEYGSMFEESKSDHVAMETLIGQLYDLSTIDIEFLKELGEETLLNMIRSQQSKRSRAKGKTMTVDNYATMMNGAVCELLLRRLVNKPRLSTSSVGRSVLDFTPEEIAALGEDQEELRRVIRNVQSQKCILKHKDNFDESDEKYQSLLKLEQVLKDLRITMPRQKSDKTKELIKQALADHDVEHLKAADSKELLKTIAAIVAGEATAEDAEDVMNDEEAEDNE